MTKLQVRREPLTYRASGEFSFFADVVKAHRGDLVCAERLRRHEREMAIELGPEWLARDRRFQGAIKALGLEARANPNVALGTGGEFVPPLWLIDRFAAAARAGRPLADSVGSIPLPAGVGAISVPRITTNEQVAVQPAQAAVEQSVDPVTTSITSPVVTIAGHTDVSSQLYEQATPAHLDVFFFPDLVKDFNQRLEIQLVNGSGTNGQALGVLNVANIVSVTYTDANPTGVKLYEAMGKAFGQMGDALLHPPELILMTPRRFAWLATQTDGAGRMFMEPGQDSNALDRATMRGGDPAFGPFLGLPTYLDGAIPLNLGNAGNQDAVLLLRPSRMVLFEGTPRLLVLDEVISGTLQTRLHFRNYVAFMGGRYPSAIGVVQGTGCAGPAGY